MPYKEREINKMYYTMGEVTEMFGVNASQIRFYEKEFDVLQPKKNKKGKIVKNSTLNWKTEKWFYPTTIKELQSIIKSNPMYNEIEEQEKDINCIPHSLIGKDHRKG